MCFTCWKCTFVFLFRERNTKNILWRNKRRSPFSLDKRYYYYIFLLKVVDVGEYKRRIQFDEFNARRIWMKINFWRYPSLLFPTREDKFVPLKCDKQWWDLEALSVDPRDSSRHSRRPTRARHTLRNCRDKKSFPSSDTQLLPSVFS